MSTESKDFFMQFQGKAIIEFSEGETLSRTEVKRMKAIITTQVDKYRAPYERASIDYPRRCVFAMTTNQEEYLKDETGNRRWLPVKLVFQEANIEWLKKNRDQLLAEAFHRAIVLEEKVYEFPEAETRKQQDSRRVRDANADMIVDWYWHSLTPKQRNEGITIHQVHRDCLNSGYVAKSMDKLIEMRISDVLRNTLRLQKKRKMVGGNQAVYWEPLVMEEEVIRIEDVF
jgi:putative DNA primase/helicase